MIPSGSKKSKRCNCKNSKCLKLYVPPATSLSPPDFRISHGVAIDRLARHSYCECFASRAFCDGCNCIGCCNTVDQMALVQKAIAVALERNPAAFRPKIEAVSHQFVRARYLPERTLLLDLYIWLSVSLARALVLALVISGILETSLSLSLSSSHSSRSL